MSLFVQSPRMAETDVRGGERGKGRHYPQ